MKKLWLGAGALSVFFFANPGITRSLDVGFDATSPPDVCDCGTICMMYVSCDVPKCNGRIAQQNENGNSSEALIDDSDDSL
jgi:hypothetical protein